MVPGFLSDAVGIVFILPGTRHLIAAYLKRTLEKKLKSGSFRVFSSGNFGSFGGFGGFGNAPGAPTGEEAFRDVTPREVTGEVIEAEVVSSSSRSSDDSGDRGSN